MSAKAAGVARAILLIGLGVSIAAMGVYVADADDAPGAAAAGILLLAVAVVLGVRSADRRLPVWAARTALAAGMSIAVFAAFLAHAVAVAAPLFPPQRELPSVVGEAPAARYAAAVDRARTLVRAAVAEQNLPGVSVAVGVDGAVVWSEGFGWRDVVTRTPVTPDTRFNIGTAASAVRPAAARLGLADTGAEEAAAWSPEHTGEPEEDFPLFTLVRDVVIRPLGFAAAQPLPGDRATFYVPRSGDGPARGRRLMAMRDLACCADGQAFFSTPSDLVRVALATKAGRVDGALAGGMVMSLTRDGDPGIAVAVTSNVAYADTSALAERIGAAFASALR
jgi:hypothetical protein